MISRLWLIFAAILAVLLVGALCYARPPENADPALAPWYQSLTSPDGFPCCSESDCRPVKARQVDGHWEVFIDKKSFSEPNAEGTDQWEAVPPEAILEHEPNPTGSAVACWYAGAVRCFVRPAEV